MRFITRETDYSLRALIFIARRTKKTGRKTISVEEIARAERLPKIFLRRLLQRLAREKILFSNKGKNGGFAFRRSPDRVRVAQIIRIFQGPIDLTHCFVGSILCRRRSSCKFRRHLRSLNAVIERELERVTVVSLR